MGLLGNSQDARFIRDYVLANAEPYSYGRCETAPEGWTRLGHGSFRSAWLSPDGVCYKVEHSYYEYSSDNASEYHNWLDWRANCVLPDRVRIPEITYYELGGKPVIAMEVVNGPTLNRYDGDDRNEYRQLMREFEDESGSSDMHTENVMIDLETRELVVVDLQM